MKLVFRSITVAILSLCASIAWAASVNINTAGANELATGIFGVGEKRAEAIIAYREKNGPFDSVDELMAVKGIGPKLLEKNRESLVVSQPAQ